MRLDFLDWSIIALYFAFNVAVGLYYKRRARRSTAEFLRGFRALYLGLLINCIILGWVNLAMAKILQLVFSISKGEALWIVVGLIFLTSAISTLSGLWGVLVTDLFQFVIKMGMVIVLAVVAVN